MSHTRALFAALGLSVTALGCAGSTEPEPTLPRPMRAEEITTTEHGPGVTVQDGGAASAASARGASGDAPVLVMSDAGAGAAGASTGAGAGAETPEQRLARYHALWKSPRHRPSALNAEPVKTRLTPGAYSCRVSREYRLRDCTVERDAEGRTILEFAAGNLLGMRGVVVERAGALEFEGWLTEAEPFGCTSCQDRCILDPSSCSCDSLPPEAIVACLGQPVRFTLRSSAKGGYHGVLKYGVYYNEYVGDGEARHAEGFTVKVEPLEIDLFRGAPKAKD